MLKKYFIAGLLLWLPILATAFVIKFILGILDIAVALLPAGMQMPGLGIIISIAIIIVTGAVTKNFFGNKLVATSERLLQRIPLVRTIYSSVKQILETIFSAKSQSFRKVLLLEYPRKGLWSIGLQAGLAPAEISQTTGKTTLSVFIPTTPNPTSGFLIFVTADKVIELTMSTEAALKFIISLGTIMNEASHTEVKKILTVNAIEYKT